MQCTDACSEMHTFAVGCALHHSDIEDQARQFAETIGYDFRILTDGTFVLEPPANRDCCAMCRGR